MDYYFVKNSAARDADLLEAVLHPHPPKKISFIPAMLPLWWLFL
jgi:hypothetical protein